MAPPPSDEHAAFGEFLRQAREASGLTLQQVAQVTKIPRRHLEALENGDLSAMPDPTYRRGEVRTYAQAVHANPDVAIARLEYALRTGGAMPAPARTPGSLTRALPLWLTGSGAILAVAALAYALLFRFDWTHQESSSSAAPTGPVVNPRAEPASVATPQARAVEIPPAKAAESDVSRAPATKPEPPHAASPSGESTAQESPAEEKDARLPGALGPQSARAVPEVRGGLEVVSEPAGARVTVNGVGWGSTPLTLAQLPPGRHLVRVSLAGHIAEERTVRLAEGGRREQVSVKLRPNP